MPDIVMSIHPEWAGKIYSGEKKIEWRKTKPRHYDSKMKVYLYETAPVKKVTGYFMVERFRHIDAHADDYLSLINLGSAEILGCVSISDLKKYQGSSPELIAWDIGKVVKFKEPRALESLGIKKPPQSWQHLKEACKEFGRVRTFMKEE